MADNNNLVKAERICLRLKRRYPSVGCMLKHDNPWQLLVATMLSAQCTDARVNLVTPEFFRRWSSAAELINATESEVENVIHSVGFYRNKAKNILACARMVHEFYDDKLPCNMQELLKLPGVARKTANIVLSSGFGINVGIAVDTHVKRISYKLGLTDNTDPVKIERDLMQIFPQTEWGNVNSRMVLFGREVCKARNPSCGVCELEDLCIHSNEVKMNRD